MLLSGIGHLALATPDLARLTSFYTRVFGASVEDLGPGHAFIRIGPTTALHAFERPELNPDTGPWRHGPIDHFTLEARDLDAFIAVRDRLIAEGCAQDTITDFGPLVSVFFTDPDGLLCELSLWKCPDWNPPFEATPFVRAAGAGAA
jgi:catechol 2,3-dioxygenase-like lactoylglutathione lyase family enzyme